MNIKKQIDFEVNEIRLLLNKYKDYEEKIAKGNERLNSVQQNYQKKKSLAERNAMFLEDKFQHLRKELISLYSESIPEISKEEAESQLHETFNKWKEIKQNARIQKIDRQNIDRMMKQISVQQELLKKEEAAISYLRSQEQKQKDKEAKQYNKIMEELHRSSDELQKLHDQNQEKKDIFERIQQSNENLKECLLEANNAIDSTNAYLSKLSRVLDHYARNKKEGKICADEENRVKLLEKEHTQLVEEESALKRELSALEEEVETKRKEIMEFFGQMETFQSVIDSVIFEIRE